MEPKGKQEKLRDACESYVPKRHRKNSQIARFFSDDLPDDGDSGEEKIPVSEYVEVDHALGLAERLGIPKSITFPYPRQTYDLKEIVGRGGAGIVVRAELRPRRDMAKRWRSHRAAFKKLPSVIALKFVWAGQEGPSQAGNLAHRNVMKIYRSTTIMVSHREMQVFAMQYFSGGNLESYIHETPPFSQIHDFAVQMLLGIDYLHNKRLAHFDLKPGNIILSRVSPIWNTYHRVKICDTDGLIPIRHGSSVPLADVKSFTRAYAPPEIMSPDHEKELVDIKADVWTFGRILIDMAFRSTHGDLSVKMRHDPENMLYFVPTVDDESEYELVCPTFADFLQRCLDRDASSRATIGELLEHTFVTETSSFEINSSFPDFECRGFNFCYGCHLQDRRLFDPNEKSDFGPDFAICKQCAAESHQSDRASESGSDPLLGSISDPVHVEVSPMDSIVTVTGIRGKATRFARLLHGIYETHFSLQGAPVCKHFQSQLKGFRDNVRELELKLLTFPCEELQTILIIFRGIHTIKLDLPGNHQSPVSLDLPVPWLKLARVTYLPNVQLSVFSQSLHVLELDCEWLSESDFFDAILLSESRLPLLRKLVVYPDPDRRCEFPLSVNMKSEHFPVDLFPKLEKIQLDVAVVTSRSILQVDRLKKLTIGCCSTWEENGLANFNLSALEKLTLKNCSNVSFGSQWKSILLNVLELRLQECCLDEPEQSAHKSSSIPGSCLLLERLTKLEISFCTEFSKDSFCYLGLPNLEELVLVEMEDFDPEDKWEQLTRNVRRLCLVGCQMPNAISFLAHLVPQLETLKIIGMGNNYCTQRIDSLDVQATDDLKSPADYQFLVDYLTQNTPLITNNANFQETERLLRVRAGYLEEAPEDREGVGQLQYDELWKKTKRNPRRAPLIWQPLYVRFLQSCFGPDVCTLELDDYHLVDHHLINIPICDFV